MNNMEESLNMGFIGLPLVLYINEILGINEGKIVKE